MGKTNSLFQYSQASFTRVTVEDGLSANTVRSVIQDSDGFIWIGTQDGLNRYDGYGFTIYRHDPDDPSSLSANSINALKFAAGRVWVATEQGLDSIDPQTGDVTHHRLPGDRGNRSVNVLAASQQGQLWIGTPSGVYRLDMENSDAARVVTNDWRPFVSALAATANGVLVGTEKGLFHVNRTNDAVTSLPHPVSNLAVDSIWMDSSSSGRANSIWLGTSNGLWNIDGNGNALAHYVNADNDPATLSANEVNTVLRDGDGVLWAGTDNGLNKLNEASGTFQRFYNLPSNPTSLSNSIVYDLFEDRSGLLWVGGYYGLNIMRQRGSEFGLLNHNPDDENSLADDNVFAITEDAVGRYWVGSATGITVINPDTGSFRILDPLPGTDDRPPYVISLEHDDLGNDGKGTIWAGTVFNGLYRIDPESFTATPVALPLEENLSPPFVTQVLSDHRGNTWAAHHELFVLRSGAQRWEQVPLGLSREAKRHAMHLALAPSDSDKLWVGSNDGLARISLDDGSVDWFRSNDPDANHGLKHTDIVSLLVDRKDRLWVGSDGAGLGLLENSSAARPGDARFQYFNMSDGLLNDTVYAILADSDGKLWFTTNRGLTRLDPGTLQMRHFGPGQGLQGLEFNEFSAYASDTGLMFFGGPGGISFFRPDLLQPANDGPPVHVTGLNVAGKKRPLPAPVDDDGVLRLGYKDYIFTVQFVALNYANPQASQYEYRLKGFSDEWIRLQNGREATFTNLDAGNYLLEVRAATGDGAWSRTPETLRISVAPAPWKTPLAYTAYLALFLLSLYMMVYLRIRKLRLAAIRERENSERLERLVNERTQELARKSRALEEASVTDTLTRLHNRRYIYTRIEQDMAMIRRRHADKENFDAERNDLLFVMIDIDRFKQVNDKYGHFSGDQVLVAVARAIRNTCRGADTVVRWGGEEFFAIAMETSRNMAARVGERLHEALDNLEVEVEGGLRIRVTCSIGICPCPFDPRDWDTLGWEDMLGLADRAMYAVKRFGRNGWMVVDHEPAEAPATAFIREAASLDACAIKGHVRITTSLAQVQLRWQVDDASGND